MVAYGFGTVERNPRVRRSILMLWKEGVWCVASVKLARASQDSTVHDAIRIHNHVILKH